MAGKGNAGAVVVEDSAQILESATASAREAYIRHAWLEELCSTLQATGHMLLITVDESDTLVLSAVPETIET